MVAVVTWDRVAIASEDRDILGLGLQYEGQMDAHLAARGCRVKGRNCPSTDGVTRDPITPVYPRASH